MSKSARQGRNQWDPKIGAFGRDNDVIPPVTASEMVAVLAAGGHIMPKYSYTIAVDDSPRLVGIQVASSENWTYLQIVRIGTWLQLIAANWPDTKDEIGARFPGLL